MPRVRRENLPRALWAHLFGRMHQREISLQQLYLLSKRLESEPEVARWAVVQTISRDDRLW